MAKADVVFWLGSAGIAGIGVAGLGIPLGMACIVAGAVCIVAWRFRRFSFLFALVLMLTFAAGHLYNHFFIAWHRAATYLPEANAKFTATGVVREEPRESERALRFAMDLDRPYHGKLAVVTVPSMDVRYGDRLRITGRLEETPKDIHPLAPPTAAFPELSLVERDKGNPFMSELFRLRRTFAGILQRTLPAERAALMNGLLFGDTSGFTREFRDAMAASGTTHLTALSGYNIAILIKNVSTLCVWLLLSRRARFAVTTLFLVLFVLMVGGEASVVRAAIMGSLVMLAGETGRAYHVRNAMTFAALGMLLIDPTLLVWNAGFLLSFLSLIGIVYLQPALAALFRFTSHTTGGGVLGWREHLLTTLAAQLMVLPVIVHYFGEFSLTALAANVLVLEFVPFTMFLGFALIAIGILLWPATSLFAALAEVPLGYMDAAVRFFAEFRIPVAPAGGWIMTLAIYITLFAIIAAGRRAQATSHRHGA
jgi:competence protein ComEC